MVVRPSKTSHLPWPSVVLGVPKSEHTTRRPAVSWRDSLKRHWARKKPTRCLLLAAVFLFVLLGFFASPIWRTVRPWVLQSCHVTKTDLQAVELLLLRFTFVMNYSRHRHVEWMLEGGALLGLVREGKLLPWDRDIDILTTMLGRDYISMGSEIASDFADTGITRHDFDLLDVDKLSAYQKDPQMLLDIIEINAAAAALSPQKTSTSSSMLPQVVSNAFGGTEFPEPEFVVRPAVEQDCRRMHRLRMDVNHTSESHDAPQQLERKEGANSMQKRFFHPTPHNSLGRTEQQGDHRVHPLPSSPIVFSSRCRRQSEEQEHRDEEGGQDGGDDQPRAARTTTRRRDSARDEEEVGDCLEDSDDDTLCYMGSMRRSKFVARRSDSTVQAFLRQMQLHLAWDSWGVQGVRSADLFPSRWMLLKFHSSGSEFEQEAMKFGAVRLSAETGGGFGMYVRVPHNPHVLLDATYGKNKWATPVKYKVRCWLF